MGEERQRQCAVGPRLTASVAMKVWFFTAAVMKILSN